MNSNYNQNPQNQNQYQNQYQNQNQNLRMTQPPAILTTKDLSYLQDAMSWELLVMKKCSHFSQECQDSEIKQAIDRTGRMHAKHFRTLLNHVDPQESMGNNF